jgi:hypothetical protein
MKQIFVGSSSHSASESYARIVLERIASIDPDRVKPLYWREAFPLSIVTFDALERMLSICSGAVLVATPEIEGQPNENVMLEFGLVAGRMGITNVVLCKHPEAQVPSDLGSLTYIELTPGTDGNAAMLSEAALELLRRWVLGLPETMEGVPATRLVHGYTGRWVIDVQFDRWRKVPIIGNSIAAMEGKFDLNIPPNGKDGFGLSISEIWVRVQQPDSETVTFEARYRACAKIFDVECLPGGEIRLRSHTFSRQRLMISGAPLPEEGWSDEEAGPWNFNWHISPDPTNGRFTVTVETDSIEWTSGKGVLRRAVGLI